MSLLHARRYRSQGKEIHMRHKCACATALSLILISNLNIQFVADLHQC